MKKRLWIPDAFKNTDTGFISILNLEPPEHTMVVNTSGEMIETNMDVIEQTSLAQEGAITAEDISDFSDEM